MTEIPILLGILSGSDGAFAQSSSVPTDVGQVKDVIVTTGTREVTKKALDSISPVDVITGAQLQQTGETTLRDALVKRAPSIGRQSMAWVAGNLTSEFTLRGLGPNYVLVLVNGKRRHPTANMTTGEGPQQGSTGADIDLIPVGAIDHIEVLRDGAAAQYGSDAIAGVVNIILKSRNHGGSISTTDGQTYQGDGLSSDGAADVGLPIVERGFAYLSADVQHKDHTVRSGIDTQTNAQSNLSLGDPSLDRQAVAVNAGYELTDDIELYGFGTFAHRYGESYQNYRLASVAPTVYPFGFSPIVEVDENDYSATIGAKGNNLAGWHWDLSSTLGGDNVDVGTTNNINLNLFNATKNAQSSFNLGRYQDSQWTNNLDVGRPITLPWLLAPSELSSGVEQRIETYEVGAAEAAALYGTGTQALQGQSQLSAGSYSRNVLATYIDLSTHLSSKWQVDMAGRVEHYSDVGNTANAKLSARYDFTPQVAMRGAVSTGFRAPSLAQEHYSSLTTSPTTAIGLLSNDSAAARALGAAPLKPEKSDNFDLGFVLRPLSNLDVTVDAYRIDIRDRIIEGSAYSGQTAINALNEAGLALPAGLSSVHLLFLERRNYHHTGRRHCSDLPYRICRPGANRLGFRSQFQSRQCHPHWHGPERYTYPQCPNPRLDHLRNTIEQDRCGRKLAEWKVGSEFARHALRQDIIGSNVLFGPQRLFNDEFLSFCQHTQVHHGCRSTVRSDQTVADSDRRGEPF
ncbi:MAG: TonB-dependent receptor [Paraburkholderia sp.]